MGIAEPLALAFGALYGVLVVLYLWERWRRRVAVPSLLLWESVREDVLRARRFRPDALFVLQLLVLTALIVGLARPYRRGAAGGARGRHIFVLDTSASMQAQEGRGTRFEAARARALARLRSLPTADEVMLVTTAPAPAVLLPFTADHDAAVTALGRAFPADTGGDPSLALAFIDGARRRGDLPTTAELFTDVPASRLPARWRDQVTVYQAGETDANLGIEALQIYQGHFEDFRHVRAYVLVENFAHRDGYGVLTVRLEGQVVSHTGFTLAPRASQGFFIDHFPGPGRVVARLDGADALAADNVAYGWIRPVAPVRVLLVSPPSPLIGDLQTLAAATPGVRLTVTTPDAYGTAQAQSADVLLLNRFTPPQPPGRAALYIYPPPDSPLFPASGEATAIEVVDWNARHPILRSIVPLTAVPLQHARVIAPPPWAQVLMWSRTGEREFPLALAGTLDGRRVACLTFDLAAEHLLRNDNVNLFLLFMSVLDWLAPHGAEPLVVPTGSVQTIHVPGKAAARDPRGQTLALAAGEDIIQPLFAGEYDIGDDGHRQVLLANFFDPEESDIGRPAIEPPVAHASAVPPSAGRTAPPAGGYGRWCYAAAALLLLLEWVAARRVRV